MCKKNTNILDSFENENLIEAELITKRCFVGFLVIPFCYICNVVQELMKICSHDSAFSLNFTLSI